MNYTLLIPDVHEKYKKLEQILLAHKQAKEIIMLGDYWDSFEYNNNPEHWKNMAIWFKKCYIPKFAKKVKGVLGNHDVQYWGNHFYCSGFVKQKKEMIRNILGPTFWNIFDFLIYREIAGKKFLFSHAGLNPKLISPYAKLNSDYFARINSELREDFNAGLNSNLLQGGKCIGGDQNVGGITWQDFRYEYTPLPEIIQIVGHTEGQTPRILETGDICLDTQLRHVALISHATGEVLIKEV